MSLDESEGLAAALVAGFPRYLRRRLADMGVVPGGAVIAAVALGTDQLQGALDELLRAPAPDQQKSPLELVREATLPVSAVLADMGVRPRDRDDWEIRSHPEDLFGLYPASAEELGAEAWQLHLQWGINKAQVVAGVVPVRGVVNAPQLPSVGLFGIPIADRAGLVEGISALGYEALVWRNPAALAAANTVRAELVIVDIRHPSAHDAIRQMASIGVRTVATGDQVDDLTMPGLLALGAEAVVELGRLAGRLDRFLPRIV